MSLTLLAARPIDFAIFFSMGALWVFGATFIYFVWRWVMRFDSRDGSTFGQTPRMRHDAIARDDARRAEAAKARPATAHRPLPAPSAARGALSST